MPSAGNSTRSRYPTTAARPIAPKRINKMGVKQQSATMIVPMMPTFIRPFEDVSSEGIVFSFLISGAWVAWFTGSGINPNSQKTSCRCVALLGREVGRVVDTLTGGPGFGASLIRRATDTC